MFDESLPYVGTISFQGSSRGGVATNVSLVRLDVEEAIVDIRQRGAGAVLPLPRAPHLHHLETKVFSRQCGVVEWIGGHNGVHCVRLRNVGCKPLIG